MDCKVCPPVGDIKTTRVPVGGGGGGGGDGGGGYFSNDSEHDLAAMVSDFLENGSGGADSWCSSDSDSGFSDLMHLAEKITFCRLVDQYESDVLSAVHSILLSMNERDLHLMKCRPCKGSCIKFVLVKLLRNSGYDAAVCGSKWQGCNKVPGGDHEYIDIVKPNSIDGITSERLIIDIDFRSHFEIARAVESYEKILKTLPTVYVGSTTKLKQLLQVMAEAVRTSLKQNSMPLPPWRSLAYLQAKWNSPYQRRVSLMDGKLGAVSSNNGHKLCSGHLRRVQSAVQMEVMSDRLLRPLNSSNPGGRRGKNERRNSLLTMRGL